MTAGAEALPPKRLDVPPPAVPQPRRRGLELLLLACAVLVVGYGYAAVGLALDGRLPADIAGYGGGLVGLALVAHLAVRLRAPYADPVLLPIALLLNGLGLVLIYRLDRDTPGRHAAPAQLVWSALGVALFIVVVVVLRDHRVLTGYAGRCGKIALALLIAPVFFPAVNGARIWIRLGPLSLQPGEFAKVLLAVFFAAYLATHRDALTYQDGRRIRGLMLPPRDVLRPLLAMWGTTLAVLLVERDLGASLLFFALFVVVLYVATGRPGWIVVGVLLAAAGATAVSSFEPHVHSRIDEWLAPLAGTRAGGVGAGQLAQSLFAFAAGGVLGAGLGHGHSSLSGFAGKSDFILATVGEELGLCGLTALFLLYALFVARSYRVSIGLGGGEREDPFGALLAAGLALIVALQTFVISAGLLGVIPLTGMVMPFLAQGGSSVVTNWVIVALLIRLSHAARRPAEDVPEEAVEPEPPLAAGAPEPLP
jgi:cell division protein FtsW (lipid II flippase)